MQEPKGSSSSECPEVLQNCVYPRYGFSATIVVTLLQVAILVYTIINTVNLVKYRNQQTRYIYTSNLSIQVWIILDCAVRCAWWWMRQYQWVSNCAEEKVMMAFNRLGSILNYLSQSKYAQQWFKIISATHSIVKTKYLRWVFWSIDIIISNIMVFAITVGIMDGTYSDFYSVINQMGTYGMGVTCLLISILYSIFGGIVVTKLSKVYSCNSRPIIQFILMASFGAVANFGRFFGMIYSEIMGPDQYGNTQYMDEALFVIISYCIPDIVPFTLIQIFLSIKIRALSYSSRKQDTAQQQVSMTSVGQSGPRVL